MAKKRPQPKKEPAMPPAAARPGSRHKGRKMVAFKGDVYEQLKVLAERNGRPVSWEIRLMSIAHLKANGLWPPEQASPTH
jgi:hypothetical protein